MIKKVLIAALAFMWLAGPAIAGDKDDIAAILDHQAAAWNAGDIEEFMAGYWKSDKLRFASGGTVTYGWQDTLESYERRYDTPEKMGKLTFSGLDIRILSPEYALAFGHWALKRKDGPLEGVFTLILQKFPEGWRIIHDHSSEAILPLTVVGE